MRKTDWWPSVAGHAEDQGGLFTAAQARLKGAERPQLLDLVARGEIERVAHGVYRIVGASIERWLELRAAWLALAPERGATERLSGGDPEGVVSHRTAAYVLGLGDMGFDRFEFTVGSRRRTRNPDVFIRRGDLAPPDWTVHEGLPVTTPATTIRMLAAEGTDLEHVATVARDAAVLYGLTLADIARAVAPTARRYDFSSGQELSRYLLRIAGVPQSAIDLADSVRPADD